MPVITILVSFYNVERFIKHCIQNIKEQTNPDFLCILVDDGSTDKSAEIAFKEIENDKRFSIIQHKTNKGLVCSFIFCICVFYSCYYNSCFFL